jgi:hypothetical protein
VPLKATLKRVLVFAMKNHDTLVAGRAIATTSRSWWSLCPGGWLKPLRRRGLPLDISINFKKMFFLYIASVFLLFNCFLRRPVRFYCGDCTLGKMYSACLRLEFQDLTRNPFPDSCECVQYTMYTEHCIKFWDSTASDWQAQAKNKTMISLC